jgi:hypothetical protein
MIHIMMKKYHDFVWKERKGSSRCKLEQGKTWKGELIKTTKSSLVTGTSQDKQRHVILQET